MSDGWRRRIQLSSLRRRDVEVKFGQHQRRRMRSVGRLLRRHWRHVRVVGAAAAQPQYQVGVLRRAASRTCRID